MKEKDMYKIANVVFPTLSLSQEEVLYFKRDRRSYYSYDDEKLVIGKNSLVSFDTYFNSFSIGKWKANTTIENVSLRLKVKGNVECKIYTLDVNHVIKTVAIENVKGEKVIKIPADIVNGLLYFKLHGLDKSELHSAQWITNTEPENKVNLGLSITTFNRQEAVKASSNRILSFLAKTDDLNAHLIVVDNGKNVELPENEKLTLIYNENLGGSGGFARGLYHLKEENSDYTHCLFMDDDASCEMESIYRTFKFFQYSTSKNLALAGSLIKEDTPTIMYENGANFGMHCKALKSGLDLKNIHSILENEKQIPFDYGAWCYYAFPIEKAEYPYPFFVRGDDVNYGLQKKFKQITLNGVCTWIDDFGYKESPTTVYLDIRSQLLNNLHYKWKKRPLKFMYKLMNGFVYNFSYMYKYDHAESMLEGLRDLMKGPSFFEKNISMKNVFQKISKYNKKEKLQKIDLLDYPGYKQESKFKSSRLFRKLTLNGYLLPNFFFRSKNMVLRKIDSNRKHVFRRKKIIYYNFETMEGYQTIHSKKRFFSIMMKFFCLKLKFFMNYNRLRKEYLKQYDYLTSKEYWEKQFFKV